MKSTRDPPSHLGVQISRLRTRRTYSKKHRRQKSGHCSRAGNQGAPRKTCLRTYASYLQRLCRHTFLLAFIFGLDSIFLVVTCVGGATPRQHQTNGLASPTLDKIISTPIFIGWPACLFTFELLSSLWVMYPPHILLFHSCFSCFCHLRSFLFLRWFTSARAK